MQFNSELIHNQVPVTANWQHILNVYQWDIKKIVHLFYKFTDALLVPVAQDAMKTYFLV